MDKICSHTTDQQDWKLLCTMEQQLVEVKADVFGHSKRACWDMCMNVLIGVVNDKASISVGEKPGFNAERPIDGLEFWRNNIETPRIIARSLFDVERRRDR